MTWTPSRGKWNWRKFLTRDEALLIKAADEGLAEIERQRKLWELQYGRKRSLIVNRAVQRAKYQARR